MHNPETRLLTGAVLLASLLVNCTNKHDDCIARADCPLPSSSRAEGGADNEKDTSTEAGVTGSDTLAAEAGGTASGGASMYQTGLEPNGPGGASGVAGGTLQRPESIHSLGNAGASGGGAAAHSPCEGRCFGSTPTCDASTNTCVECTSQDDTHCIAAGKVCGSRKTCVECESSQNCTGIGKPVCDDSPSSARANTCVQCLTNDDCRTPEASQCDTSIEPLTNLPRNVCVACSSARDCSHIPGKAICLPASATEPSSCVQCTKDDATACSTGTATTLCHGLTHECTNQLKESSGLCSACVSDAQCMPGQACVPETFGLEQTPLYACLWKKGDPSPSAPVNCSDSTNQPYIVTRPDVATIDGAKATVCGLAVSTCGAVLEAVTPTIACAPDGLPVHSLCTFGGYESGRCVKALNGEYQCSPRCSKNADCYNRISWCETTQGEMACHQ
jgi:hypothetical protein